MDAYLAKLTTEEEMRNLSDSEWTERLIWRAVFEGAGPGEFRGLSDAFTLKEIALIAARTDISVDLRDRAVDVLADTWDCDECGELIDSASDGCLNEHCGETPHERMFREAEELDASGNSFQGRK